MNSKLDYSVPRVKGMAICQRLVLKTAFVTTFQLQRRLYTKKYQIGLAVVKEFDNNLSKVSFNNATATVDENSLHVSGCSQTSESYFIGPPLDDDTP